jgi:hypothetical protein
VTLIIGWAQIQPDPAAFVPPPTIMAWSTDTATVISTNGAAGASWVDSHASVVEPADPCFSTVRTDRLTVDHCPERH